MRVFVYPSKIAYYGGFKISRSGSDKGSAYAWYGDKDARFNEQGEVSASIVVDNPDGLVINGSGSRSAGGTYKAECNSLGDRRSAYGNDNYQGATSWTVGVGYQIRNIYGATNGGKGGDLGCFNAYNDDEVYNRYGVTVNGGGQYEKGQWPVEKITTSFDNGETVESASWTQLANGYFTGPPTYRTTGNVWRFSIVNKTSLSYGYFQTDITIVVSGPHTTQQSMPEHFLWIAGGLGAGDGWIRTRVQEACVGFYDFRADIDNGQVNGAWPNYRRFGINSLTTVHSTSYQTFTISGKSYQNRFIAVTASQTQTGDNGANGVTKHTEKVLDAQTLNTSFWANDTEDATKAVFPYPEEDEVWPKISTVEMPYQKNKKTQNTEAVYRAGKDQRPDLVLSKDQDGDLYATTISTYLETGYAYSEIKDQINYSNSFYQTSGNSNTTYYGMENDYVLTYPIELGYIHRKRSTSKKGYYYTNPDQRYQDAKDVGTDLDVQTYKCYDAICIDILRYANGAVFQTAITNNNSLVLATRKSPRSTTMADSLTVSLKDAQNYQEVDKVKTINEYPYHFATPAGGFLKVSLNEYGETASYEAIGFSETTDQGGTAVKLVPMTNNTHYVLMLYDSVDARIGWVLGVNDTYYGIQPRQIN